MSTIEQDLETLVVAAARLRTEIGRRIVGQVDVVEEVVLCLFAGGHVLLEGVPGLAKTLLVRTLADALALDFRRIQFTPDRMPGVITGTEVIEDDHTTGRRAAPSISSRHSLIPGETYRSGLIPISANWCGRRIGSCSADRPT